MSEGTSTSAPIYRLWLKENRSILKLFQIIMIYWKICVIKFFVENVVCLNVCK